MHCYAPAIRRMMERAYSVTPVRLFVSVRVRDGVSNLHLSFSDVSNWRLSFSGGSIRVLWTHFYYPLDISRKDVFCLAFYFKGKYFVLVYHILSETICLFCVSVSIAKWIFGFLSQKIYFLIFLCWILIIDVSQQHCENFRKKWTSRTCWKSAS